MEVRHLAGSRGTATDGGAFTLLITNNTQNSMMEELYEQPTRNVSELFGNNEDLAKLYDDDTYTAYTEDLEFMWRWTIYRDNKLIQEGCSLTEEASRRAVNHVMAFFNISAKNKKNKEVYD